MSLRHENVDLVIQLDQSSVSSLNFIPDDESNGMDRVFYDILGISLAIRDSCNLCTDTGHAESERTSYQVLLQVVLPDQLSEAGPDNR
jgi:hypothetical protein